MFRRRRLHTGLAIKTGAGFTLVETVVSVTIFVLIFLAVYSTYAKIFEIIALSRVRGIAMAFVNERIEIARNLPYGQVGTPTGIPRGILEPIVTETRSNIPFEITTVVRNIDDPFDGLIGGLPNDTSPADYKLVDMTISCLSCKNDIPFSVVTYIAPKNLEISSTTNGALFINVTDGNGLPVVGADVHIENPSTTPPISMDDISGVSGMLQLVDIPPGNEAYRISVSKDNYTTDATLSRTALNPNPTKPHATIAAETVTAITMSIDRVSAFNFNSLTQSCVPVPNIDFSLVGSRVIGNSPSIKKYDANLSTDGSGQKHLSNMEWDTYSIDLTDATYQLIGTNSLSPVALLPNETKDVDLIVAPKNPRALMVTVKDGGTGLPISSATVNLSGGAVDETFLTGRGFLKQTDWSGGAGQATTTDFTRYWSSDGNIDISSPVGDVKLRNILGEYVGAGEFISSAFDTGSISNYHELTWLPGSQPVETGSSPVRMQFATNDDGGVWNFVGPDGTSATYYEPGTSTISAVHNDDRFARYKVFFQTASTSFTPTVSDVSFTFTSACVPPGQVTFEGLSNGTYDISVSKAGYTPYVGSTTISQNWQALEIVLTP